MRRFIMVRLRAFADLVLKPTVWTAIFLFLLNVFTFGCGRLSFNLVCEAKSDGEIRRFLALVPRVVWGQLSVPVPEWRYLEGYHPSVVHQHRDDRAVIRHDQLQKRMVGGLDPLYAILLVYVALMLVIVILGSSMIEYITVL